MTDWAVAIEILVIWVFIYIKLESFEDLLKAIKHLLELEKNK